MNKNLIIVLAGGFLIAVLVAVLVQSMVQPRTAPVQVQEEQKVDILVAAQDLSVGHELQDGDVRWQSWPEGALFTGAIVRDGEQAASDVLQGRLRRAFQADEPMLKSAVITQAGNFLAASLRPGYRAVAIEVEAQSMAGGFIGPGDFVDVVLTYKTKFDVDDDDPRVRALVNMNISKLATETILQNVRVVAVDQEAVREDENAKIARTVTLEVTLREAEKLALAQELGALNLVLRGIGDNLAVDREWMTTTDERMTSLTRELYTETEKLKKTSGPQGKVVRIYNGDAVQSVPSR